MTNEQTIWKMLMTEIKNPYGVAGLMGNLYAESSLSPTKKLDSKTKSGKQYVEEIDSGIIDCDTFSRDGIAFGLAQWRYWSRKEQLWIFANEQKRSIGDLEMQVQFLIKEIKTYKTVWNTLLNAKGVREASDAVMLKYEKPSNTSEASQIKRAEYGQKYFVNNAIKEDILPENPIVATTTEYVNYREGNSKSYAIVGRADKKGTEFEYVATSKNGWHAIVATVNHKKRIVWMCGDFCEVKGLK